MNKVVSVHEAVSHIPDGAVLAINGMLFVAGCEPFYEALEARFLQTGAPRNITMYATSSVGGVTVPGCPPGMANRLAHPGLVSRVVASHYQTMPRFHEPINSGAIEGYLIPQGTFSQMIQTAARRIPRTLTKMGLHTFVDPRYGGGKLSAACLDELCDVATVDGEEFLSYKTIYPDACIIRGTTVDAAGNITFEEECGEFDALQMAMATKNNGGIVIVQVKRQSDERANPMLVKVPAGLVDYVYINPRQSLVRVGKYDPRLNGVDLTDAATLDKIAGYVSDLPRGKQDILERACKELRKGHIVNLGIGTPYLLSHMARKMGVDEDVTFTNEIGLWGGYGEYSTFGLNLNTEAMMSQGALQNFYEGGGLDISFAGALEVDAYGNVNVLRSGGRLFGVGGFNSITANAGTVVFCLDFFGRDGKCKIVDDVECINYNAAHKPADQRAVYVTDRCAFELKDGRLHLTDINPRYSREDILPYLPKNI